MASSSVSQEDVENDYEKLEKRSRIRTARARQINPQGCRVEASVTTPLTLDIETDLSELHLEPVSISPYTFTGASADTMPTDTSPKGRDTVIAGDRGARKDSVRAGERNHPNKTHHGIKGKQQRDRRKLREKRRSTGVVHLASTESTGGSTSGEEELSECDVGTETKRNTQQNETIAGGGEANGDQDTLSGLPEPSIVTTATERKNSGRGSHAVNSHNRSRMRTKNAARSEDMEADDELGDKTDNDHERISPNSTMPSLTLSGSLASEPSVNSVSVSSSRYNDTDLVKRLEEKERRIQYLELKVQQMSQESATILAEHDKLKHENNILVAALKNKKAAD